MKINYIFVKKQTNNHLNVNKVSQCINFNVNYFQLNNIISRRDNQTNNFTFKSQKDLKLNKTIRFIITPIKFTQRIFSSSNLLHYAYINFEKELEKQIELETFENLIKEKNFDSPSDAHHKKLILGIDINSATTGFCVMDYDTKEIIDCGAIENLVGSTREYGTIIRDFLNDLKKKYSIYPQKLNVLKDKNSSFIQDNQEQLTNFEDEDDIIYEDEDDIGIQKSNKTKANIKNKEKSLNSNSHEMKIDKTKRENDFDPTQSSYLGNRIPLKDCQIITQKPFKKANPLELVNHEQKSEEISNNHPRPVQWQIYIESFLQKYRRMGKNDVVHRLVAFNCVAAYEASLILEAEPLLFSHVTAKSFFRFGRASSGKVMRRRIFNYFKPLLPKYYEAILTKKKKQFASANFDIADSVMISVYGRAMVRLRGRLYDDELFKSFLFTEYFTGEKYKARVSGLRRSFDLEKNVPLSLMLERDDVQDHLREKFSLYLRDIVREEIIQELGLRSIDFR